MYPLGEKNLNGQRALGERNLKGQLALEERRKRQLALGERNVKEFWGLGESICKGTTCPTRQEFNQTIGAGRKDC